MNERVRDIARIAMVLAIVCLMAQLSFNIGFLVPLSMHTAGVLLAGIILGPKKAAICMLCYAVLGAVGFPVFSFGRAGLGMIFGNTGGFISGFIPGAAIIGLASKQKNLALTYLVAIAGIAVSYVIGVLQFSFVTSSTLPAAFTLAAAPFLPMETVKIALFVPLALRVHKALNQ